MNDRSKLWTRFALLIAVVCLLYLPSSQGAFLWDDDINVTENPLLSGPDQLRRIWSGSEGYQYYPLTFTSYWLQDKLFGLGPAACHWVNMLLHGVNAGILWLLLVRLRVPGAFLGALLFAIHPVCVESVAWITERKNVLAGGFYLLSLWTFTHFDEEHERTNRTSPVLLSVSFFSFLLAALAKTHVIVLPAVLGVYLVWKGRRGWFRWVSLLPYAIVALILAGITIQFEQGHVLGDSSGEEWTSSPLEKVLLATRIFWFYVSKAVFPFPLAFIYEPWTISVRAPLGWVSFGATLLLWSGLIYLGFRKRRTLARHMFLAVLYAAIALLPILGFVPVYFMRYSYVQDHFQYFALMGLAPLLVSTAVVLVGHFEIQRRIAILVGWTIAAAFIALNLDHQQSFRDPETLWVRTIDRSPHAWMALTNLGVIRSHNGDHESAVTLHEQAVEIAPDRAEPHNNLGFALGALGRRAEAVPHYERAIEVEPKDAVAYLNLGNTLVELGRVREAIFQFEQALKIEPGYAAAENSLGTAFAFIGDIELALAHWSRALRLNPEFEDAERNFRRGLGELPAARAIDILEQICESTAWEQATFIQMLGEMYVADERVEDAERMNEILRELRVESAM